MIENKKRLNRIVSLSKFIFIFLFLVIPFKPYISWAGDVSWNDKTMECKYKDENYNYTIRFETLTTQGDATLISINKKSIKKDAKKSFKKYILIDAGKYSKREVANKVKSRLKGKKINVAILTHNDLDHISGIAGFNNRVKIDRLYYNIIRSRYEDYKSKKPVNVKIGDKESGKKSIYEWIRSEQGLKTIKDAHRIRGAYEYGHSENNILEKSTINKYGQKHLYTVLSGRVQKINIDSIEIAIIPPISESFEYLMTNYSDVTEKRKSINNGSMAVVIQTPYQRVIFGGDYEDGAISVLNNYEKGGKDIKKGNTISTIVDIRNPARQDKKSLYNGVRNYIFGDKEEKTIIYKVSHHGTGNNRRKEVGDEIQKGEKRFINKINPDFLVVTGYKQVKNNSITEYYRKRNYRFFADIFDSDKIYRAFKNIQWDESKLKD